MKVCQIKIVGSKLFVDGKLIENLPITSFEVVNTDTEGSATAIKIAVLIPSTELIIAETLPNQQ